MPRLARFHALVTLSACLLLVGNGIAHAAVDFLDFVEAEPMPAIAEVQASGVVVSPDGDHVYVAAGRGDAVVAYSRDASTGALTFIESEQNGVNGVFGVVDNGSVAISPDGAHVYTTSTNTTGLGTFTGGLGVFSRDSVTGELTFVDAYLADPANPSAPLLTSAHMVSLSPGGEHVYVASPGADAITVWTRNVMTGELTLVQTVVDDVGGVDGVDGVVSVNVSADGAHLYATGFTDDAVSVFSRNPTTGELTFVQAILDNVGGVDGLDGVNEAAVSADGSQVYTVSLFRAGSGEDAVVTFDRNPTTGELTFVEAQFESGATPGLTQVDSIVIHPNQGYVFVTGVLSNSLVVFERNRSTGELTYVGAEFQGMDGVDGLSFARWADVSPDGAHVYVAALQFDAEVGVFSITPPEVPVLGPVGTLVLLAFLALAALLMLLRRPAGAVGR